VSGRRDARCGTTLVALLFVLGGCSSTSTTSPGVDDDATAGATGGDVAQADTRSCPSSFPLSVQASGQS
jgi:hypothetical protein